MYLNVNKCKVYLLISIFFVFEKYTLTLRMTVTVLAPLYQAYYKRYYGQAPMLEAACGPACASPRVFKSGTDYRVLDYSSY